MRTTIRSLFVSAVVCLGVLGQANDAHAQTWVPQTSGTTNNLRSVHFPVDATTGYAVGDVATLLKTTDGGANWVAQTPGTANPLRDIHFPVDAITGYAVGNSGTILKTTNGGTNWVAQTSGTANNLHDVHFLVDAITGYAVGNSGTILKTTNGGANWGAQTSGTTNILRGLDFPVGATTGYAVGNSGTLLKTTDGGANWIAQTSGTANNLLDVDFPVGTTTGYAVGGSGTLLKTTDGGANWVAQTSGTARGLNGVSFPVDANTGYVVGGTGTILKTTDGGANWGAQTSGTANNIYAVHFPVDANTGYAVGHTGTILRGAAASSAISGTVFEDKNYGGGVGRDLATAGGVGQSAARVELYNTSGVFVSATTTAVGGTYSFSGLATGNYTVRVVNDSVRSARTGYNASLKAVQTYRTDASSGTAVAVADHVGGQNPSVADAALGSAGATMNTTTGVFSVGPVGTAQSITNVTLGASDITGVDFGYSFNVIVNTNDADQGSLRQFITNANGLGDEASLAQSGDRKDVSEVTQALPTAYESSIFMISDGNAHPGLRAGIGNQLVGGVAVITPATALPAITGASTVVDGTTQTVNVGNTNSVVLGAGGTVGVDGLTLSTVPGPEVEIAGVGTLANGLVIQGANAIVRGLSIHGFGSVAGDAGVRVDAVAGALIEGNVLGAGATSFTDPGATQRNQAAVDSQGGTGGIVRNNLIGFGRRTGVYLGLGSTGWAVSSNEIRDSGMDTADGDGITVSASSTNTASGNLITGSSSQGVALTAAGTTGNTFVNNTLTGNGVGIASSVVQSAAVTLRAGPMSTTLDRNVIRANYGAGVAVNNGVTGTRMTQNSFDLNGTITARNGGGATGQIGIDLNSPSDDINFGTPPFYTINDNGDPDAGGNALLNFAVLDNALLSGGNLTLNGWSTPGATIELFISDGDGSGFGEGKTYLATMIEGSGGDSDTTASTYGPGPINGLVQGTDSTNRFAFTVPAPAGVSAGTLLTASATVSGATSEFSGVVTAGVRAPALFSTVNQIFWVGKAPTAISAVTIADTGSIASITAANDIRIRIPAGFNMTWDTSDLTATIAGPAAAKVSGTVSYEDAGATLVLDVTANFAVGDSITVSDLSFMDFTAASGADNLELEVFNDDVISATDDKTVEILPPGTPTFFSEDDQSFRVGDPTQLISMITLRADAAAPTITAATDIRIHIPFGFNMRWDNSDNSAVILGTASAKVSSTVSFENGGRTLILDVLTDFDPNDLITIEGLGFRLFTAPSLEDNLELELHDDGVVSAVDPQIKFIVLLDPPTLSSSKNQGFTVGDPDTQAAVMRVTANDFISQVTATDDIRIRIPSGMDMVWDVTQVGKISGQAKNKVSPTVSYEDGGQTVVLDVLVDFAPSEWINVSKVWFTTFASASSVDNLELLAFNDGVVSDLDDKTKKIFGSIFRVDVWPTIATRDALPSNGTDYTVQFTVSNTGNVTDDFDLLTSTSSGAVITVVSITGLDVTQGIDPDSARISNLAASDSRVVTVTYSAGMAPVATIDTLIFLARPISSPAQTDQGRLVFTVMRPDLTVVKSVNPPGTSPPGTDLTYAVVLTNIGSEAADSVVNIDDLPAEVEFKVGSVANNFPGGVGVTVEYSNDGGSLWSYSPVSLGCGAPATYDACVTNIRWTLQNPLISVAPDNMGSAEFVARIK